MIKFLSCEPLIGPLPDLNLKNIDWVIVGVWGGINKKAAGRLLDGRTYNEMPSRSNALQA